MSIPQTHVRIFCETDAYFTLLVVKPSDYIYFKLIIKPLRIYPFSSLLYCDDFHGCKKRVLHWPVFTICGDFCLRQLNQSALYSYTVFAHCYKGYSFKNTSSLQLLLVMCGGRKTSSCLKNAVVLVLWEFLVQPNTFEKLFGSYWSDLSGWN